MHIQLDKSSFFLGESIPIEVVFDNKGNDTITIENPSKSSDVIVHLMDLSNRYDYFYSMKKIEVLYTNRKTEEYVTIVAPKEEINVAPGMAFNFITDLNERLYAQPGHYDCYLSNFDTTSNHLNVQIIFNQSSVEYLFKIAQNKQAEYSRRDWAMKWVQKIYPGFKLRLFEDDEPDTVKVEKESVNFPIYEQFSQWWQINKTSRAILDRIANLNDEKHN